jgi:hypothetical protein
MYHPAATIFRVNIQKKSISTTWKTSYRKYGKYLSLRDNLTRNTERFHNWKVCVGGYLFSFLLKINRTWHISCSMNHKSPGESMNFIIHLFLMLFSIIMVPADVQSRSCTLLTVSRAEIYWRLSAKRIQYCSWHKPGRMSDVRMSGKITCLFFIMPERMLRTAPPPHTHTFQLWNLSVLLVKLSRRLKYFPYFR